MPKLLAPLRNGFTLVAVGAAMVTLGLVFLFGRANPTEARTTLPEPSAPAPTPAALAGAGPNLSDAALSGRQAQIGVFGDSFGDGIWWALDQQLRGENDLRVHRLSRAATGFTSYQQINVLEDIRTKLDRQPVDVAIVSFGANDAQSFTHEGHPIAFLSDEWRRIIGGRVDAVVALLRERGAQVYWIGLPRMRSTTYEGKARQLNNFMAERMRTLGVPFIDTVASTSDTQGRYVERLPNPRTGELMQARSRDGIHMTMNGYTILTQGLSRHLKTRIAAVRAEAARQNGRQASSRPAGAATSG